jgi:Ran GTPase-activating protein (RanGAP) involved in mRNA processing and transport
MFRYFQHCKDRKVTPLPILFKIVEGKLRLENYTLNKEITKSLASVCEKFRSILHSVHFNRNGMKDEELSILIHALSK